jgi:nicotinate-nucleotide adenylyltransferase
MSINKMKLGLDIHGVLDANPEFFKPLCLALVAGGSEVHLITGAMRNSELCVDLLKMGFLEGVHYTHFFSIADHHSELGTEMWFDKKGRPYINDEDWNVTKGHYAQKVGLTEHWDDSQDYEASFKENSQCEFFMYTFEKCFEYYQNIERLITYKLALFGGAFNPPHFAHLKLAEAVEKYVDKILVLPAFSHREKQIGQEGFEVRYPLCQLHFKSLYKTEVSSLEKDFVRYLKVSKDEEILKGVGSTYELISFIKNSWDLESCELSVFFVLGEDNLYGIESWYKSEELMEKVYFISFPRGVKEVSEESEVQKWYERSGNIHLKEFELMNVSSTEIKEGLALNKDMSDKLTFKTYDWIKAKGLYKS